MRSASLGIGLSDVFIACQSTSPHCETIFFSIVSLSNIFFCYTVLAIKYTITDKYIQELPMLVMLPTINYVFSETSLQSVRVLVLQQKLSVYTHLMPGCYCENSSVFSADILRIKSILNILKNYVTTCQAKLKTCRYRLIFVEQHQ